MFRRSSLILAVVVLAASCASPSGSSTGSEGPGVNLLNALNLQGKVSTFSGLVWGASANKDGPAGTAVFYGPDHLTTDGKVLYVTDQDAHSIRRVSLSDGSVTTIAGGLDRTSGDGIGAAADAKFSQPDGITLLNNCLYISDTGNKKVKKLDLATGTVSTLVGTGTFNRPNGLTTDGTSLYVCDSSDSTIRRVDPADGTVTTLVGKAGTPGTKDDFGQNARLNGPRALACDGRTLFVADTNNNRIRRVDLKTLEVTTIAGLTPGSNSTGPANQARLGWCGGITTDGTNVYFSDATDYKVFRLDLAASSIALVAGNSVTDVKDGQGSDASFALPAGLVSDGTALYVADTAGPVIRKIL